MLTPDQKITNYTAIIREIQQRHLSQYRAEIDRLIAADQRDQGLIMAAEVEAGKILNE